MGTAGEGVPGLAMELMSLESVRPGFAPALADVDFPEADGSVERHVLSGPPVLQTT